MEVAVLDPRGAGLVGGVERLWTGAIWAEGPLVLPEGALIVSDIPNNRVLRWDGALTVWRQPADFANGRTLTRAGDILTCEHGTRRVTRTDPAGRVTVVADAYQGKRLNSPNDVVEGPDGAVWFTDPTYGIDSDHEGHKAPREQAGNHVYRVDPSGAITVAADDFDRPNGLAFSPDGHRLYIADSGALQGLGHAEFFVPTKPRHIRVFGHVDGRLTGGAVFATVDQGVPDGLRVDPSGRVWTSAGDGIRIYHPDGTLVAKVLLPEVASNLCFDRARGWAYVTATTSIYRLRLGAAA